MDDAVYPVMSRPFWSKAGRPRRAEDLVGLRLLHDRDPHASWEVWRRTHGPKSLDVRKGSRFASSDLVLRAALQGQGVALARHRLAMDDVASGLLVRPLAELAVELGPAYWLVLPKRSQPRPALSSVIAWLKKEARKPLSR
jgi:LysR family glycine cleavage system transcriptional activator